MGKLLVGDVTTLLLMPVLEIDGIPNVFGATGLVPFDELTDADYNKYIAITTNATSGAGGGGNITCTVQDDYTLGSTDPELDDTKTPCSRGASGDIKRYNFEAEISVFLDADPDDPNSNFNMTKDLVRAPDIPYIFAERTGYSSTTVSDGHDWDVYYVHTDNPVDTVGDDEWEMRVQTFVPKGIIKFEQEAL